MWQVAWSHPKFGALLASCSYDGKVIIYREQSLNQWTQAYVHVFHEASVNSIAWAPHEYGLSLACASADGSVSIISYTSAYPHRLLRCVYMVPFVFLTCCVY